MRTKFSLEPLMSRHVIAKEAKSIRRRRQRSRYAMDSSDAGRRPSDLAGLALSGGGIRSATFCLGVLQSFHARGLFPAFDYLSTVSGGGFVGGWLMAWLARGKDNVGFPDPETVARGARTPFERIDPIHHLRRFSNYLTPRKGLLSADTWRGAAGRSRVWKFHILQNRFGVKSRL